MRRDLERVRAGQPVEATPLLPTTALAAGAVGATQVIPHEAPPSSTTAVLTPEPEPEKSRWWVPVLVVLLVLTILGVFLWLLAQNLLNNDDEQGGKPVTVPNVVGEDFFDARAELEDAGLVVGKPLRVESENQDEGLVLKQDPAANEKVDKGTEVVLTVVKAPGTVVVPPIAAGASLTDAQAALTDAGLTAGDTVEQASDEVDEGDVIAFDPASGTEVDPASTVNIVVSTGPDQATVPSVTCLSFNAAQNQITKAGLVPSISSDPVDVNPQCPLGNKVAQQDPAAGSVVDPGSTVTISSGEEAAPTGPTATGPTA
jgi:beta-lactam-binding protein with PASTA domain